MQDSVDARYRPVTVGEWMITYLLLAIPIVNIVLIFVWAFGSNTSISKANWAKALLLWFLIGIGIYLLFFLALGTGVMLTR